MSRKLLQESITKEYKKLKGKKLAAIPWEILFDLLTKFLSGLCPAKDMKTLCTEEPHLAMGRMRRLIIDEADVPFSEATIIAKSSVEAIAAARVKTLSAIAA